MTLEGDHTGITWLGPEATSGTNDGTWYRAGSSARDARGARSQLERPAAVSSRTGTRYLGYVGLPPGAGLSPPIFVISLLAR